MNEMYLLMVASPVGFDVVAMGQNPVQMCEIARERRKENSDHKESLDLLEKLTGESIPKTRYFLVGPVRCMEVNE